VGVDSSTAVESTYVVRGETSPDAITKSLQALLPTRHSPIPRRRLVLLDTFDCRVRRAGARLTRSGVNGTQAVAWERRAGGTHLAVQLSEPVNFAWDLPDGPLQGVLAPVIGVRRLFAQLETEVHGSRLDVLDDHRKTIARVRIESGRARLPAPRDAWHTIPSVITVTGLRGYEDFYERLVPLIESRPGVEACPEGFDDLTLRQLGASPAHTSSLGMGLVPTVEADVGARQIHQAILGILVANEPGLRANLDTEFLHDFRVAVRRTRSLLGQIRRVFPPEALARFSTEFSWLGRLTGPPRDMDVLVLSLRAHRDGIDGDDLEALTTFLLRAQRREHKGLVAVLNGDRYQRLLSDWGTFLAGSAPAHPDAPDARRLLADVIARRAWRLSRRISRGIETIAAHLPAEQLHQVRLDAKKLRYLIDVTPAFYDAADLARILGALKKLQRVLGEFNDAELQELRLVACGRELAAKNGPPGTLRALGRLADECRERRDGLRRQVADGLARFRSHETRSACRRAFKRADAAEPAI
jgi:CHAD domain-containing protein